MLIHHSKPTIDKQETKAVSLVLKSGHLAQGKIVRQFEEAFARSTGCRFALALNSGTAALHLALLGLKIAPGDEIILPSYVCTAVLNVIYYLGAVPRIADIKRDDFNIDPKSVAKLISPKTKALIVPHMFGLAADMDALRKFSIPIVEDCALSTGATYNKRKVGSFGKVSVFSFYATKMMTTGEGGMLLTNDKAVFSQALDLRDYDNKESYQLRFNYKMSDLAASIGLIQLKKLPKFIIHRQKIAQRYNKTLSGLPIQLPIQGGKRMHTYYRYVVGVKDLSSVIGQLMAYGIEAKRPVYKPLHHYLKLDFKDYPVTQEVYSSALSLPIYPDMSVLSVNKVSLKLRKILKH